MFVTGTASPPPGLKKSMLQRGLQDSVCVASTSLSMSLHAQFFTLRQISHIWPLSLMHKTHWDTGPWHLLFPGPPALSRVFLKVLFVYHGISVQRAGGRDPAGPKLSLRAHPLSLLSPPVPLSHSLVPHLFQLLCSCLSRPVLILFVSTGYGLPLLPQREGRLPKRPACPHQGAAAVRLRP